VIHPAALVPWRVIPHAGHDDPDGIGPGITGGGTEKNINRRPVPVDQGTVLDLHIVFRPASLEQHVMVAGDDEGAAAQDEIPVSRPLGLHLGCWPGVGVPSENEMELIRD